MSWFDVVEYYFFTWFDEKPVPDTLYGAVRESLGSDFNPELVHPAGSYEEGRVLFLMVKDDEPFLVHIEPSVTTISFPGSLHGGVYSETVRREDGRDFVEGTFTHERIGDTELHVRLEPTVAKGAFSQMGAKEAFDRFTFLRQTFRRWATEPQHQPSPLT